MANQGRSGAQARAQQKLAQRVAQQKVNTTNLLTPGTTLSGLVGSNNKPFDGITDTLDGAPVIRVENKGFQQMGRGVSKGGLPKSIQYAGTTLYGLKQGDDVLYRAATETPLMKTTAIETALKPDTTSTDTPTPSTGASLNPNATEQYSSNFKAGQANMSDIQEMYADRKDLQEWAKANPALAQKEFAKSGFQSTRMKNVDIQDQMDDTGRSRNDIIAINNGGLETVIDGSSIGNSTPQDAQAFKNAAAQLVAKGQLPSSMNAGSTPIITGVTPMIEGIELSTAVKPDYKAEMEDGVMNQLAKGLDIPTKRFASQNLKDLFMNNMLGK